MGIEPFKARVVELALAAAADQGFALAGGNALIAHGLLNRRTDDVDLFSPVPGGVGQVLNAVCSALRADGFEVEVLRAPGDHGDNFAELAIRRGGQSTQMDLGQDWRARETVTLAVGPVLHLDDAVGSKMTALLGRALPRDFVDIAAALNRYSRKQLLELAFDRDRGLRVLDVALATQRLDRLENDQFERYALTANDIARLRDQFADWPRDAADDQLARAAYDCVHQRS